MPEPGISGIQRRGTERETGRPGPVLEEEKDWEITMDQFSSIISNLNLLQMFILSSDWDWAWAWAWDGKWEMGNGKWEMENGK